MGAKRLQQNDGPVHNELHNLATVRVQSQFREIGLTGKCVCNAKWGVAKWKWDAEESGDGVIG